MCAWSMLANSRFIFVPFDRKKSTKTVCVRVRDAV